MPSDQPTFLNPFIVLVLLYIVSIVFFHFVEGWSFLDAAYFTTITITTIGYGDIVPVTPLGKIGVIALVFAGVSTAFYVISYLAVYREKAVDPHIQKRLRILQSMTSLHSRKMDKEDLTRIKKKIQGVKFS